MQFFPSLEEVPAGFGPSAVTIGKFDGLHLGHRAVIGQLIELARAQELVSTVLTFDRHPLSLLRPEECPEALASNDQKRELIESSGVDAMLMVPFTHEFSALEPEAFVETVLVRALNARLVLVGPGFSFGHAGRGDVAMLAALGATHGFETRTVGQVTADDHAVSSTTIRAALDTGDVGRAARLLGRAPSVRAEVVHGAERGRALGYPTANLSRSIEGFVPADGVYAARLLLDGESLPAAVSVGNNPTFEGVPDKQVEAHVLDRSLDLYGRVVTIEFVDYIRPMRKFESADALSAQMNADESSIREILGVPAR